MALGHCDQIAGHLTHLALQKQAATRAETEALVVRMVAKHGVKVEAPQAHDSRGSVSYVTDMLPVLVKALETKGYLPGRESSPWRYLWEQAIFRMQLNVTELREGNYLSSANRLTRIEAHLALTSRGEVLWQSTPVARSQVPLPKLSAYVANRLAISPERSEEFERLLYDNARSQIDEKLGFALNNMPPWPATASAAPRK